MAEQFNQSPAPTKTEFDSLNNKIKTYNIGSVGSISSLKSNLLTCAQGLNGKDCRVVNFYASAAIGNGFTSGQLYQGVLNVIYKETNALNFSIIFESTKDEPPIWMNYKNGTWTIDQLALNSQLTNYVKVVNATLGNTGTINAKSSVVLYDKSVSSVIPSGYKAIAAWGHYPGDARFAFNSVGMVTSTTVNVEIFNWSDIATSGTVTVDLLCIRT